MAATLPDLETVNLRRGASNGAELRIELNRPERMNAWDAQLSRDLLDAIERVEEDETLRAVPMTGAGRGFCSGADLAAGFDPTPSGHPDLLTSLRERYHPVITAIRTLPKPVVAAVNGGAVGVGCSLALACDLVLAGEAGYFLLAFVNIGLVPDGGSSAFIPNRIGLARATEMAMLGERISGRQAFEWGLANAVHADDELRRRPTRSIDAVAAGPDARPTPAPSAAQRAALRGTRGSARAEALQQEQGPDDRLRRGRQAFLQKRAPSPADERSGPFPAFTLRCRVVQVEFRAALRPALSFRRRLLAALLLATVGLARLRDGHQFSRLPHARVGRVAERRSDRARSTS